MRNKAMLRMLVAILMIVSLMTMPVSAAQEEVSWGDAAYKIIVPGFIEVRTITIYDEEVEVIVAEKPELKSNNRYDFFEIVTTDAAATMITSMVGTTEEQLGDLMADLENGRLMFSPTMYASLDEIEGQPLYLGFSFRNADFEVIYEFPVWFLFEEAGASASAPAPTPAPVPVQEPVQVKEVSAVPTSSKVVVNDQPVAFEAYTIEGYNYFKLRDLAMAVTGSEKQFEVSWDGEKNAINLVSDAAYTPVGNELTAGTGAATVKGVTNQSKIYVDGEVIELEAYTINGNNYFKLRDVAAVFDFSVGWDEVLNQITISTASGYVAQ